MNETPRQDSWFDPNGKFKGWPKGVPHGPRTTSPWGDLSGRLNRQKFQSYLHNLEGASRFTHSLKGLIFYRGLSENVRKHIRRRLAEIDPDGLRLLLRLNKAMTWAQNRGREFDPSRIFADERARLRKRVFGSGKPPPGDKPFEKPDDEPIPLRPPRRKFTIKQWETNLLRRAPPPTPAEVRMKKRLEAMRRY